MPKRKTKKRASGEGLVRKRPDGRWEARITVGIDPVTGKPKFKHFYGKTQAEAIEKRDAYLTAVRTGTYVEPQKILFGEWVNRWLELFVKPKVRQSTYAKYQINTRTHIVPALGHIELQKLTTEHIQEFYNEKAQTHSSSVIAILHQIINGSLKQAVKQRVVLNNPAEYTERPQVRYREVEPLTEEEVSKFLQAARGDRLYAAFLLDLFTGLRRGELLALRWSDVDFKAGTITVRESLSRVEIEPGKTELVFSEPKTESGKRTIPLLPEVVQELKRHKARQNEERLFFGREYEDNDLVFCTPTGKPIDPRNFLRKLKGILKKAGLREEIRVHTLRHTFGNVIAQAGENPRNLQALMGHADIRTTLGTYCHSGLDDKRRAVEKLAPFLNVAQKRQ